MLLFSIPDPIFPVQMSKEKIAVWLCETRRISVLMIKGFADIVIADITVGQINHYSAEIGPRTVYPLYGSYIYV